MSDAILEKMISSYMLTPQPLHSFGWQGGEPTLMGLDFFRKAVELQQKHGPKGATVGNGLQTNATLIDDNMAAHFAKYKFLLGVSLDGPEDIHDLYRKNSGGDGSHSAVMRAIEILRRHDAQFNILTLVSRANVGRPAEVYRYLLDNGFLFHQYIPCVEFDRDGNPLEWSVTGREWGEFMCGIFDSWIRSDTRNVSVRLFDSIIWQLVHGQRNICHMGRNCCQYFVVEYNGDVYPCDFFVKPELKLGNVMENTWEELQSSEKYKEFGALKSKWNSACERCQWFQTCSADCLKHRLPQSGNNPRTLSSLCEGWRMFYAHSFKKFRKLAEQLMKERTAQEQYGSGNRRNRGSP
jgi:uncharacterized protein